MTVDGRPVDREIRSKAVTTAVSPVSAIPEVRVLLVAQQRELIGTGAVVVEGRDIGTVVAPDAPLKIFLTASPDARATRRSRQDGTDRSGTAADLDRRDAYDSSRAHSPLRAAEDAVHVDTTTMDIDEVIQHLVDLAGANRPASARTHYVSAPTRVLRGAGRTVTGEPGRRLPGLATGRQAEPLPARLRRIRGVGRAAAEVGAGPRLAGLGVGRRGGAGERPPARPGGRRSGRCRPDTVPRPSWRRGGQPR